MFVGGRHACAKASRRRRHTHTHTHVYIIVIYPCLYLSFHSLVLVPSMLSSLLLSTIRSLTKAFSALEVARVNSLRLVVCVCVCACEYSSYFLFSSYSSLNYITQESTQMLQWEGTWWFISVIQYYSSSLTLLYIHLNIRKLLYCELFCLLTNDHNK